MNVCVCVYVCTCVYVCDCRMLCAVLMIVKKVEVHPCKRMSLTVFVPDRMFGYCTCLGPIYELVLQRCSSDSVNCDTSNVTVEIFLFLPVILP
jgi:hypothetical protein